MPYERGIWIAETWANIFCPQFFKNLFISFTFGCAGSLLLCGLFSSCSEQELLSNCGARASHWAASLLGELERRLSSCGTRALLLCGMWTLPRPGIKPVSPALTGRFLSTAPPGAENMYLFNFYSQMRVPALLELFFILAASSQHSCCH